MTLFIEIRFWDIVDVLLVAILLFELYHLLKGTAAIHIFFGVVSIFLAWRLTGLLGMTLLSQIFGGFVSVGFIALIVVFQPEIRKFLLMLGSPGFLSKRKNRFFFWKVSMKSDLVLDIEPLLLGVQHLSASRTGALIVIAQQNELAQYIETGIRIDAEITAQLIENIFIKNSPLHDGAIIIHRNRVKAAHCILPVSGQRDIPHNLGLRHRAALGISEQSDALSIVVSEETGHISYAYKGALVTRTNTNEIRNLITDILA
ncbi:MAG: diadenylate cyclase CdaA [Bacteroidales bacterium]|nr:diadenylate cyclase CdaA [Bacteroidales bacterium]